MFATSPDGTRIADDRAGNGPSLVLLHGGLLQDRRSWDPYVLGGAAPGRWLGDEGAAPTVAGMARLLQARVAGTITTYAARLPAGGRRSTVLEGVDHLGEHREVERVLPLAAGFLREGAG